MMIILDRPVMNVNKNIVNAAHYPFLCYFYQALVKNKSVSADDSAVSVRRFGSFGLLQMLGIDVDKEGDKCHRWYEYSCKHCPAFKALIRYMLHAYNIISFPLHV